MLGVAEGLLLVWAGVLPFSEVSYRWSLCWEWLKGCWCGQVCCPSVKCLIGGPCAGRWLKGCCWCGQVCCPSVKCRIGGPCAGSG